MNTIIQRNDADGLPEINFDDLRRLEVGVIRGYHRCVFVEVNEKVNKHDLVWLVNRRFRREFNYVPTIHGISRSAANEIAFVQFGEIEDARKANDVLDGEWFKGEPICVRRDEYGFAEHFFNLMNEVRGNQAN